MAEDTNRYNHRGGANALRGSGVSQRGRPRGTAGGRSAPSGISRFVDSMMSPFVQCWQPPLDLACGNACADVPAFRRPSANEAGSSSIRPAMVSPAATARRSVPPPPPQPSPSMSYGYEHVTHRQPPRVDVSGPSEADVLCGRGGSSNRHNVHFRELVAANKATYTTLTKKQKMLFSRKVVDQIHQAGGRFLSKDQSTGRWCDIGLQRSLEKASQALREKTTNTANTSVIISDEGGGRIEATAEMELSSKTNSRTVEAPPLIIPHHIQHIYRPKPATVTPTFDQGSNPGWVAEFPSHPGPPTSYHPSDRVHSMPAPHMGAFPFTTRQMSKLTRQPSHTLSIPGNATPIVPHTMSWQQQQSAYHHHNAYTSPQSIAERPPSPEYPSSAASCTSMSSSATHSAPEFHQYYRDFEPPRGATRPHPRPEHPPEVKRQRTREEEKREQHEEEEVILVESEHQSTLNNSLQDGSEQLPLEVASKLCLHEKVIKSPSEMCQSRGSSRRRGEHYYEHDTSMTKTTTNSNSKTKERLNTSAEAADMAGLAALSTAAFLRLDEGE